MVNTYKLVNPYIKGEFETKIKTKNSVDAAKKFYSSLSEHFNNSVPKFYFTIQKGGSKNSKFYHFEVEENRKGDEVDFAIRPLELENKEKTDEIFVSNFKSFKGRFNGRRGSSKKRTPKKRTSKKRRSKSGSKKSKDSMENNLYSSDNYFEEDNFYRNALEYVPVTSQPISYLYYDPFIYNLESVFFPTFYAYLSPYVELNTSGLTYTKVYVD